MQIKADLNLFQSKLSLDLDRKLDKTKVVNLRQSQKIKKDSLLEVQVRIKLDKKRLDPKMFARSSWIERNWGKEERISSWKGLFLIIFHRILDRFDSAVSLWNFGRGRKFIWTYKDSLWQSITYQTNNFCRWWVFQRRKKLMGRWLF